MHRTRLVEHHEIVSIVPLPQGKVVMVHEVGGAALIAASAAAWDWSEHHGVDIETSEVRELIFDTERNEHALRIGVAWTVDVGHATDDEWTWSARWEHWRAWFESMRLAAYARLRVAFRDADVRTLSALAVDGGRVVGSPQNPDAVFAVVDGDRHTVVMNQAEDWWHRIRYGDTHDAVWAGDDDVMPSTVPPGHTEACDGEPHPDRQCPTDWP